MEKWIEKHKKNLTNKTFAITGATGGIGKEICRYLLYMGADIIMLNRNDNRSEKLKNLLLSEFNGGNITYIHTELEDIESVKSATRELEKHKIDFLILNAGAYSIPRRKTSTGFDNVFQINFISQYYIARKFIENHSNSKGKIITVGSIAHLFSKIDINDCDFSKKKSASKVYGNSKRFLMYSLFEILKGNKNISLSIAHPGISFTGITANYPPLILKIIKYPMKLIFMKPEKACLSIINGVLEDCEPYTWIGPHIFNIWGKPHKKQLNVPCSEERKNIDNIAKIIYEKL